MCGIIGVWKTTKKRLSYNIPKLAYLGLYALQHRGQESAGISLLTQNKEIITYKDKGLVQEVFDLNELTRQSAYGAIGHTRYSTAGTDERENIQPIVIDYYGGKLALAHNGNLKNAYLLRQKLASEGIAFRSSSDSEIIAQLIAKESSSHAFYNIKDKNLLLPELLKKISHLLQGAYSLVILTSENIIALRDPLGFRPLFWGKIKDKIHLFASESCALDLWGADFYYELKPGEVIMINREGDIIKSSLDNSKDKQLRLPLAQDNVNKFYQCIFEFIYFARPDSTIFGENVYLFRQNLGRRLFRERPTYADLVVPIPDSGVPAALGYALEAGIPYELGLMRNHYIGRTFINPRQAVREFGVEIKLNPLSEVLRGKRVILVDDSIVRGTTCKKIIRLVKKAGTKQIHLRVASPPIRYPCYFGIDTPNRQELIAASLSIAKIRQFLGVDSLHYLSLKGLLDCISEDKRREFCTACFDGNYPY